MRRGHFVAEGGGDTYIDWLKSIGCVFYLDAAEGNSKDQINDVPITLSGNGSFSYDSSKHAFYCKSPSSANQYIGIWNNGMSGSTFPYDNWTSINIIEKITNTNGKYLSSFGVNCNTRAYSAQFSPFYNITNRVVQYPSGKFSTGTACNYSGNIRYFYQNGSLYDSRTYNTDHQPSRWVQLSTGTALGVVIQTNYDANIEWYNYRTAIFNTVLDLTTINQIINHQ